MYIAYIILFYIITITEFLKETVEVSGSTNVNRKIECISNDENSPETLITLLIQIKI